MPFFKNLKNKTVNTGKRLIGYDQIVTGTETNYHVFKNIVKENLTEVKPQEEQVYLSRQAVKEAQAGFKKLCVLFGFLFVFGILYTIGNLINQNWSVAALTFAFSILALSVFFRYHFWLFQIKKRTLGLNFTDYYNEELKRFLGPKQAVAPKQKDKK